MRSAEAIRARVTASNDDDALARGENRIGHLESRNAPVLQWQKLHREVYALQFSSRHRQIARLLGSAREQNCVEVLAQVRNGYVDTDVSTRPEFDPFGIHLFETPVEHSLLHLEIGNAI